MFVSRLKYRKLLEHSNRMTELYYREKHLREQQEKKSELSNLKDCPFCGGKLREMTEDYTFDCIGGLCEIKAICTCGMEFRKVVKVGEICEGLAKDEWNKRATLDK